MKLHVVFGADITSRLNSLIPYNIQLMVYGGIESDSNVFITVEYEQKQENRVNNKSRKIINKYFYITWGRYDSEFEIKGRQIQ